MLQVGQHGFSWVKCLNTQSPQNKWLQDSSKELATGPEHKPQETWPASASTGMNPGLPLLVSHRGVLLVLADPVACSKGVAKGAWC
jgi:hypothetical protein